MPNSDLALFPALDPYDHDWLSVSALHSIYYEQCGNPMGQPVVVLHGGPGSGCTPMQRRFFDPLHYRVILLDQRGCNRSLPLGCVEENTTPHLVSDIEALRHHLGISRWLVFGGSWGSTLALAYASKHPQAITGMILRGIFLCRAQELDWFLSHVRNFFPEAWEQLAAPLSPDEQKDILHAYHKRVFSTNHAAALAAAVNWGSYESSIISLLPSSETPMPPAEAISVARARVQLHYLVNRGFLEPEPLLERVPHFCDIPSTIIQGRYDMVCPPASAHALHLAWPQAQYRIIPDAGHSAMEPGIIAGLVAATESFKTQYNSHN